MPVTSESSSEMRREWLAVLSRAPREALSRHAAGLQAASFEWLRQPEIGLVMLRGRVGNGGDRFNVGEASVTRCVVRHRGIDGHVAAGLGYVIGRDAERATWIARLDAMLQQPEHHAALMRDVIGPLRDATTSQRAELAARTAASKVRFFTLTPETL